MTLSKARIKYIRSLHHRKYRQKYNNFIVEGDKIVRELLLQSRVAVEGVYALPGWLSSLPAPPACDHVQLNPADLRRISALSTPNQVLAVARIPEVTFDPGMLQADLALYLDGIQDPGNMGTILRIADWFGIPYVFCSHNCVDLYNPKVIQASMGAFLRVSCLEMELAELLEKAPALAVLGATMDGDDLFSVSLPRSALIVIGNEGRGLSQAVADRLDGRLTIPGGGGAESLNAAVATGIICAVYKNRTGTTHNRGQTL